METYTRLIINKERFAKGSYMNKVICIGECLIDMVPQNYENMEFNAKAGGAPANVAACVGNLGGNGYYLGKMSMDGFSDFLIEKMKKSKVNTDFIIRDGRFMTAVAMVTLDKDGDRQFNFYRHNTADLMLDAKDIKVNMFEKGDILHFCSVGLVESPSKYAHIRAINLAKDKKSLISFDINLRLGLWKNERDCKLTIKSFLPYADIIKLTIEELQWLTGFENEKQAMFVLKQIAPNATLILITKGKEGASGYLKNCEDSVFRAAEDVKVVDTTGAGDCFSGCVLYNIAANGMIKDLKELKKVMGFASIGCGYVIGKFGAMESMPSLDYIVSKLK